MDDLDLDPRPNEMLYAQVSDDESGQRLDKWLATSFPDVSRTRLKALIEDGRVAVDGRTITDASGRVKSGQAVEIVLPEAATAEPVAQDIPLDVVYEDDDLIVVNKPPGLVVHPAAGNPDTTLVNGLLHYCSGTLSGIGGVKRPGIVHRLDKDTSGLLVAAKNDLAHHGLARQFAEHSIERAYWALVWGLPSPLEGRIEGNIGRSRVNRKKMAIVNQGGKTAVTRYRVVKTFQGAASLIECRLETGRTHQIRVHLSAQGHSLIGDQTYGRAPKLSKLAKQVPNAAEALIGFQRQALHAFLIGFEHPRTGEKKTFRSEIPSDLNGLMELLEQI